MSGGRPPGERARYAEHCESCGAPLKEGAERCAFCGVRVAPPAPPPRAGRPPRTAPLVAALLLAGLAIAAAALLARRPEPPPAPPPPGAAPGLEAKRAAGAACEERVRRGVRSPLRVIAFRSALVAEGAGGEYVVTGTVELQSLAGELSRRRYRCRAHPDPQAGLVLDEAALVEEPPPGGAARN